VGQDVGDFMIVIRGHSVPEAFMLPLSCRCDSANWHPLQFADNLRPLGRPVAFLDHHADGAKRQTAVTEEGFLTTLAFLQFHTTPPCERRHHTPLETDEKPRRWGD
jgi:hypothetical protein